MFKIKPFAKKLVRIIILRIIIRERGNSVLKKSGYYCLGIVFSYCGFAMIF
jgi:hypothetical protein